MFDLKRIVRPALCAALLATSLPVLLGMGQPALPMAEAHLAYRLGQYDKAVTLFGEAGENNAEAQLWKGYAAFKLGNSETALLAWEQAASDPQVKEEAQTAVETTRSQLKDLAALLDRYGAMRAAGTGGPGASTADWRALADRFAALSRLAEQSLVGRRAALLAADAFAFAGDTPEALSRFAAAKDQHPLIGDWALWRMAALDRGRANEYLTALVEHFPDSPLLLDARVALAETRTSPESRRTELLGVVQDGGGRPAAERALYLLTQDGGTDRAGTMIRYWNTYPEGRYLDKVVHDLATLPGASTDTLYRIASYFYFEGDYGPATRYFSRVRTPVSIYRMGRAYWGLGELDKAIGAMKTVIGLDGTMAGKAWLTIGQIEGQRHRWSQASDAYNKAARSGGEAGVTARGKLSKIHREQNHIELARSLERSIVASFPWSEEATTILWQEFWGAFEQQRWNDAIINGRRLARHNPNHQLGIAAQYWLGRVFERQGQSDQASAVYKGLVGRSPSTYYGWRAYWRERELSGRGMDPWFGTRPGRTVDELPIRWHDLLGKQERELLAGTRGTVLPREMLDWPQNVRELLYLRQFDIADAHAVVGKSPNLKAWLSYLQSRYRQAIREEKGEPRLNYPLGFAPLLLNAASRQGIDPLLFAALVREESRFDPAIKSWVGATGLGQLMPTTAEWVVKQVPDVKGRPLTDPHANLQLGAWYLAYTHRVFDGGSVYAVAAYNGGPGAVARWKKTFGGDPDEFVEAIPYSETRLYVKKVYASYWNYVKLYGNGI